MTTAGQVVGGSITGASPAAGRAARLRALSLPALLRLLLVLIVATSVAVTAVAVRAITDRADGARGVDSEAALLLRDAEALYVALADADAAASTAYLQAGDESGRLRARYKRDLRASGDQLAAIASRAALSDESRSAVAAIARELSLYAGQVELARANNLQGHAVGAAYLRAASSRMRNEILPAATTVYEDAARGLYSDYRRGAAFRPAATLVAGLTLLLALLIAAHLVVSVSTRRILNVGLATATVLVLLAGTISVAMLSMESAALRRSQRHGADQLLPLSTARILVLQSLSNENVNLIERGTDPGYMRDFKRLLNSIGGSQSGLIGEAAASAAMTGESIAVNDLTSSMRRYQAAHDKTRLAFERGQYDEAVKLALGSESQAAAELEKKLGTSIERAAQRLDKHAVDARNALDRVALLVAVLLAAAAACAAFGLVHRIREYS